MYYNTIDEKRKQILEKIVKVVSIENYYMAGGTSLSLQCGNRLSYDFDFFVQNNFDLDELILEMETIR